MNYDSVKFCTECRRPKPREGFRFLDPGHHRQCCAECYERNRQAKEDHRSANVKRA